MERPWCSLRTSCSASSSTAAARRRPTGRRHQSISGMGSNHLNNYLRYLELSQAEVSSPFMEGLLTWPFNIFTPFTLCGAPKSQCYKMLRIPSMVVTCELLWQWVSIFELLAEEKAIKWLNPVPSVALAASKSWSRSLTAAAGRAVGRLKPEPACGRQPYQIPYQDYGKLCKEFHEFQK